MSAIGLGLGISFGQRFGSPAAPSFDPATLALTGWWRGSFTGSPWTPTASAGSSGSNGNLTEATNPPATGAAVNGLTPADFDGSSDRLTAGGTLDTFVDAGAGSIAILFRADTAAADGAIFNVPGLCGDAFGFVVGFTDAGLRTGIYDGAWKEITISCSAATWALAQMKWDGTNAYARINGGSWSSVASGALLSVGGAFRVGVQSTNGDHFFDGQILDVMTADTALSDGDFDNLVTYCNARYGLSL